MLFYGTDEWILLNTDTAALKVFERKVLRKILGPVRVGDDSHIRFNFELYKLFNGIDVVRRINIQRMRWLGHIVRMEDAPWRWLFNANICGISRPYIR